MSRTYPILLASLVITLAVSPLLGAAGLSGALLEVLLLANLAAAAFGAATGAGRRQLLLAVAAAGLLRLASSLSRSEVVAGIASLIWVALALVVAVKAFRYSMSAKTVDTDHICAALSVYMLFALFYGLVYWRTEVLWPGGFAMSESALRAGPFDLPAAIYLSFITLATVGFGDIVPATPAARGLVITEAVLGQFYMVVMVTRLVSLYAAKIPHKGASGE